jgi:hypothetical protein
MTIAPVTLLPSSKPQVHLFSMPLIIGALDLTPHEGGLNGRASPAALNDLLQPYAAGVTEQGLAVALQMLTVGPRFYNGGLPPELRKPSCDSA